MSERNESRPSRPATQTPPTPDRDTIARLLRLAGPRPSVPEAAQRRVRAATHQSWRLGLRATRRRRYLFAAAGALAATLAIALISLPSHREVATEIAVPVDVATLQSITGTVTLLEAGRDPRVLRAGEILRSGTEIETGVGARAALELVEGGSLRLDHATRLRLLEGRVLALEAGRLYFDSADERAVVAAQPAEAIPVEIRTELGVIRDIGTQFEVRLVDGLGVRVREGLVNLDSDGASHEAGAGVELRVSEAGELSRHASVNFGPSWEWILDVASPFELDEYTLEAFLAWVSRETGWKMEFVDADLGAAASDVVLVGSLEGQRPDRVLTGVLQTCGLEHRFEDGVLLIEAETR